ncbi:MAG TPA: RAMP superfamily CRISPR-associated protein [Blastocatellia bacterium]|nr:RAMP superfamily CRISPR-associated protein [Blastocatellia bacterium]
MSWDYYAWLAANSNQKEQLNPPQGLAAGHVDALSVSFFGDNTNREITRQTYIQFASRSFSFPDCVRDSEPNFGDLVSARWLGLQVDFKLLTPWYSKDDRVFHVLDNPVRKDRVFGVPFMSAASWKGMLRWACRMQAGLREHLENGKRFEDWRDPDWILHLFGNEKGEEETFHQGALVFYPTWFDRIGFEVINPHSRERRAGTQPIYYEVVPGRKPRPDNPGEHEEGGKGSLYLLYAPWPGMKPAVDTIDFLPKLLEAIETLLTTYGISAKRTVGWGTAQITKWKAFRKGQKTVERDSREQLWQTINAWFQGGGAP